MISSINLVEFNIENYRSIKDLVTLSMQSTPRHNKGAAFQSSVNEKGLLNTVALYGANASGKSNVLRALFLYKKLVSGDFKPFETEPIEPFLLDDSSRTKDTILEAVFEYKDKYFVYGFSLATKTKTITGEWLRVQSGTNKRVKLIYERAYENVTINKNLLIAEHGISRNYLSSLRDDELFINTVGYNPKWSLAKEVKEAWRHSSIINTVWHDPLEDVARIIREEGDKKELVLELMQEADFTIADIRVAKDEASDEYRIHLKHEYTTEKSIKSVWFDLRMQESTGTQKFFKFTLPILYTLKSGALMVLDEFDSTLHPDLLRYIVQLFNDKNKNINHAQLVLTTHDTNLMELFAMDQIYFTQKNAHQLTDLFSLSDIKGLRKESKDIDKKYLRGDFGAIPRIIRGFN